MYRDFGKMAGDAVRKEVICTVTLVEWQETRYESPGMIPPP